MFGELSTEDLHLGTTVRLRDIPGPLMRIIAVFNDMGTVQVFWFDRQNHPHVHNFYKSLLVRQAPFEPKPRPLDEAAAAEFEHAVAPVETAE